MKADKYCVIYIADVEDDVGIYYSTSIKKKGGDIMARKSMTPKESNEVYKEHFELVISTISGFHFEMKTVIGCLLRQYKNGKLQSSILNFLGNLKNNLIDLKIKLNLD
ncbi:MAG: hypothetical protein ACFFDF_10390 [Candidatus Odinarchaeota archaeon]